MKRSNKNVLLAAILVLSMGLMAACGTQAPAPSQAPASQAPASQAPESPAAAEPVTITLVGSTSVEKLAISLGDLYRQQHPNVTIDVQAPGSGAGIKAAAAGTADIGMSSRGLKDSEKEGLNPVVIANDGIAVVVHADNPVSDLSSEQISGIFKGEITNWKDVGGIDKEILLVTREQGSGTRSAFEELLELVAEDGKSLISEDKAISVDSTNGVAQNVRDKDNAIGYISLGSLTDADKAIAVDGVDCTPDNVKSGSYSIARPFLLITKGEPQGEVKSFLDFVMGAEGQAEVSGHGYVSPK